MNNRCPGCCHSESIDARSCGCCLGIRAVTPLSLFNRPGLSQLRYRIGTYAEFLESMIARLSSKDYPALTGLTTRDSNDPAMALIDAWAMVADVLTFYQERIANEGYLPSATERLSILELARLVGYKLQPGVAASVFLAYTLDEKFEDETTIPTCSRAQSIPAPGELPQTFETSEDLKARAKWNNLKPRLSRPQTKSDIAKKGGIYLRGVSTNLKPNDPLIIDFGHDLRELHYVQQAISDSKNDRTLVLIEPPETPAAARVDVDTLQKDIIAALTLPPSLQPRNTLRLKRTLTEQFKKRSETGYAAVKQLAPILRDTLSRAEANAAVSSESPIKVFALRRTMALFGHNHPGTPVYKRDDGTGMILVDHYIQPMLGKIWPMEDLGLDDGGLAFTLLESEEKIARGTWVAVEQPGFEGTEWKESVHRVEEVRRISLSALGMAGKAMFLKLDGDWVPPKEIKQVLSSRTFLKKTTFHVLSEELELAEAPIEERICGGLQDPIELDGFYDGLESGRWVIVSGERDIRKPEKENGQTAADEASQEEKAQITSGIRSSELAMLASVTQATEKALEASGEQNHTYITLAEELQYCFKRDTITIHGNVVKATHGETRKEVLGSGDGTKTMQAFALKQKPLTYTAASNQSGVASTLAVRVNEVLWHEADALAGLGPTDRRFVTQTNDGDQTIVIFGNGNEGARLPTGTENIKTQYRSGIGKPGNVKAQQISLLADKPLGVKEVINPLRASGGADRENREQARKNAPLAVMALDRLVSVRDYADFAHTFAGIGKASAVELSADRKPMVHVTIAGADDIPIDETSDLFLNLGRALRTLGDPFQPVQLAVREMLLMVLSARVRIHPDYLWEDVATRLRAALLSTFGFEIRGLGQNVYLSEVYAVMQAVRGVIYVDVENFGGVPEKVSAAGTRRLLTPDEFTSAVRSIANPPSKDKGEYRPIITARRVATKVRRDDTGIAAQVLLVNRAGFDGHLICPAQLALLSGELPDTLILTPITD